MTAGDRALDAFRVDPWTHVLGGIVSRHPRAWIRLGNLETRLLADELARTAIDTPVYIAGLARSGSTLLLEILGRHPAVTSHRYSDYPLLFTPYAWRRFLERVPRRHADPVERAHGDGIRVTPESPEAFEEMLWMAFFPDLHDPYASAVLDGGTSHPPFESFYRDHLRKLLRVSDRDRYVSKGNYNLTRLAYLRKLFPDARFVVPVRDPVWHIASLMKEHEPFRAGQAAHPRAVPHLQRVGHFEFGVDRRPVNTGDRQAIERIHALWRDGAEVEGWARYWDHVHRFVARSLERDPALREATLIVRHGDFCRWPADGVRALLDHCRLESPAGMVEREAAAIRKPDYYRPAFTAAERETIDRITGETAARLGLAPETAAAVGTVSTGHRPGEDEDAGNRPLDRHG